jgi:hypothetical protein
MLLKSKDFGSHVALLLLYEGTEDANLKNMVMLHIINSY